MFERHVSRVETRRVRRDAVTGGQTVKDPHEHSQSTTESMHQQPGAQEATKCGANRKSQRTKIGTQQDQSETKPTLFSGTSRTRCRVGT